MDKLLKKLEKYGLHVTNCEGWDLPCLSFVRTILNSDTIISHYFIVKYINLIETHMISSENLESSFYEFEKKYFSKYFFREDTDLKWNYYLIIIVDEQDSKDSNICQLEQDDKYLRKLVMTEDEFEIYIAGDKRIADAPKQKISGIDTYGEWQRALSSVELEGILTHSFESRKIQNYIEENMPIRLQGRPIVNWENNEKVNPKNLVKKIEKLDLNDFRNHCLSENLAIPFTKVNLISGCNGTGKSSICAAIEYAITGEVYGGEKEEGEATIQIRNSNNNLEKLKSNISSSQKRDLDQLWYGTTTIARKSNLNRNFHTFNYLGLEASGQYMHELDINKLIKNVLFGNEVTQAEQKMNRYRQGFEEKKKEYSKQINEISQEINGMQLEEEIEKIPKEDIINQFIKLGYRGEPPISEMFFDKNTFPELRMIIFQTNTYVDVLESKCKGLEYGKEIIENREKLARKREQHNAIIEKRENVKQSIIECSQKYEIFHEHLNHIYEDIQNTKYLIAQGKGLEKNFFAKQDFLDLIHEYEEKKNKKEKLENWMNQYQFCIEVEGEEQKLDEEIQNKQNNIHKLCEEIQEFDNRIEQQKQQSERLDLIFQEMFHLTEQYMRINRHKMDYSANCPLCGTKFSSEEELTESIKLQKKWKEAKGTLYKPLLSSKAKKEIQLDFEENVLNTLQKEKEKLSQKKLALSKLQAIIPIDEGRKGIEIQREVAQVIEEIQKWLEQKVNLYEYAMEVTVNKEFVNYVYVEEWNIYLEKMLEQLDEKRMREEQAMHEQHCKEQELNYVYQALMEENIQFSEQEWEECKHKSDSFLALKKLWELNENRPILSWIKEYYVLVQMIKHGEEVLAKQQELNMKKAQIKKLEDKKKALQGKVEKCKKVCDVIGRQKHLEDVMQEFLNENARQIELYFKLLHRPKEFEKLKIENGNISFVRTSNEQPAESKQMSTGQRMALAFSVMITLHKSAENAPDFLMLDEPVANLDDMHVLNLIDLLRELAIGGTQIIMTTADAQMAKFLRRKFSFFEDEYSHFELIRKGSEQTKVEVIHYSPNKKEEKYRQSL